uniref:Uncharacterized protein n=1 Tax=uncultured Verrucomicrobiales bacterium HF4000_13K17 TaxID=710998 RepID=E0XVN1_9BACT|nr:hypothetical protein [uncultured Verrucomicrobiales bacterium HF4000_13K17]
MRQRQMKKLPIILSVLLVIDALACRFNVRDVGFVDLGSEKYRLFIFVPDATPAAEVDSLKSIAYATYLESNVKAEVLTASSAAKSEAAPFLPRDLKKVEAVFVSPDGKKSLEVSLTAEGKPLAVSAWDGLESVFDSPRRNGVVSKVYEHYGVILIVDGKNADENLRIRRMADTVVASISGKMDKLEKEIREPPVVEVISAIDFAGEKAFMWSLGITEITETPQVAILYGRGRIIGPVLRDERLDERALTAIVNTIGLNCECGLDRKWMQGTMIPQQWDEDVQKRFADQLGFDPESPAIRIEMSQILAKGQGANRQTQIGGTLDDLLMGYREGALNLAKAEPTLPQQKTPKPIEPTQPKAAEPKPPSAEVVPRTGFSFFGWAMMAGVPILVVGAVILLLGRKRDS